MTSAEQLLTELYQIDPDLQQHHAALLPVIEELLRQKPDVTPNKAFVEKLRTQLLAKATEQKAQQISAIPAATPAPKASFWSVFRGPVLAPALALLIIAGAAGYTLNNFQSQRPIFTVSPASHTNLFAFSVTKTKDQAFGDLRTLASNQNVPAYGRGGGGGGVSNHAPVASGAADAGKMLIAPAIPRVTYAFSGTLDLPQEKTVAVLKRQKNTRLPFEALGQAFNLGMIDLSTFDGRKVDTVALTQDGPYGYTITLALGEGMVSLSPNWFTWPHPEAACSDEACFNRLRLKKEDVPSDDVLIQIAQAFAAEHKIDLSGYGKPVVDKQWERDYQAAQDKSQAWVPDALRVIFPLQVEGQTVVDEGGNPTGLSLTVNIRAKKVSDVWGLTNRQYIRSDYAAVTDPEAVQAYLRQLDGAFPVDLPAGATVQQSTVTLGTPTVGYATFTRADETGMTEELLVPSLLFPVQNVPQDAPVWRRTVTVPLAADMLNKLTNVPQPRPMPLDTVRGSATGATEE